MFCIAARVQLSTRTFSLHRDSLRTEYGFYKTLLMNSGLCRTSFEISNPHHDLLDDSLNNFYTAYIDNILVFSDSLKEQIEHMELILARLHERGLQAKIDECALGETKLRYVCLDITIQGI